MMNGLNSEHFLASAGLLNRRAQELEDQITSGYRVRKPSDDPSVVEDIIQLRAQQGHIDQTQKNLGLVKAKVDAADIALAAALKALDAAVVAGAQGATSTSADQRSTLAIQIEAIQKQLDNTAGTTVQGRLVFSSEGSIQDVSGVPVPTGINAADIFDPGPLEQLRQALLANDQQAITDAITAVKTYRDTVNDQAAVYGGLQNRISAAMDLAQSLENQNTAQLSETRDTDAPAAILELTQVQINLSAAMSAQSQKPRQSLFDFLS